MTEIEAIEIISGMVLAKMKTRPMLLSRWGALLKLLYEEYPELPHATEPLSKNERLWQDIENDFFEDGYR